MRILICGDRDWKDWLLMSKVLREKLSEGDVVIHGACRGADRMGGDIAEEMGLEVEKYPAKWQKYGLRAGPIRNQKMLDQGGPELVLVFHGDLNKSKGTKNMISLANKAGVSVEIYPQGEKHDQEGD